MSLNQQGIAHLFVIFFVVVGTAVSGSYFVMRSNADSFSANGTCDRTVTAIETAAATAVVKGEVVKPVSENQSKEDIDCQAKALDTIVDQQKIAAVQTEKAQAKQTAQVAAARTAAAVPVAKQATTNATNALSCEISGLPQRFVAGSNVDAKIIIKNNGPRISSTLMSFNVKPITSVPYGYLSLSKLEQITNFDTGATRSFSYPITTNRFMFAKQVSADDFLMQFDDVSANAAVAIANAATGANCQPTLKFTATVPKDATKIQLQPRDFVNDKYSDFPLALTRDRGELALVLKIKDAPAKANNGKYYNFRMTHEYAYGTTSATGVTKDVAFLRLHPKKQIKLCISARTDDKKAVVSIRYRNFDATIRPTSSYKDYCYTKPASVFTETYYNDSLQLLADSDNYSNNFVDTAYVRAVSLEVK